MRIAVLALAAALTATPALACQWIHEPEPVGASSAAFIARRMVEAATYVDVVIADDAVSLSRFPTTAIIFRVEERLKGASEDRFTLYGGGDGQGPAPSEPTQLTHWTDPELGVVYPMPNRIEGPDGYSEFTLSSCEPAIIEPVEGHRYLVFRGADGRLLGDVEWRPGFASRGYAFVEAEHPVWMNAVRSAAARP